MYSFQASGWGCNEFCNDSRYCPDCKKVIGEALEKVPIRFGFTWAPTKDFTAEELLAYRDEQRAKTEAATGCRVFGERVTLPLWDMHDPGNLHSGAVIVRDGKEYKVETWSKKPEMNTVEIAMEENLETGELKPWRAL